MSYRHNFLISFILLILRKKWYISTLFKICLLSQFSVFLKIDPYPPGTNFQRFQLFMCTNALPEWREKNNVSGLKHKILV